ncbi:MAG TPA: NAD(P)-binding protein [Methyloceanibacter sp.]|nr:NAD(P)-binding protein [Methyloceanibacter sp.]
MAEIEAEIVIVGSGIAGALLAARLAQAGVKVAILEAGAKVDRAEATLLECAAQDTGVPLSAEPKGRSSDQQRPRLLVSSDRAGQIQEHLSQSGRRDDVALARELPALRSERFSPLRRLSLRGRLADHLRGPRAVLQRGRGRDRRVG